MLLQIDTAPEQRKIIKYHRFQMLSANVAKEQILAELNVAHQHIAELGSSARGSQIRCGNSGALNTQVTIIAMTAYAMTVNDYLKLA